MTTDTAKRIAELREYLGALPADLCWTEDKGSHRNIPIGKIAADILAMIDKGELVPASADHAAGQRIGLTDEQARSIFRDSAQYEAAADAYWATVNKNFRTSPETVDPLVAARAAIRFVDPGHSEPTPCADAQPSPSSTAPEPVTLLREFCDWRDRAQDEDDDCEYLNGNGWRDLDRLTARGRAILKLIGEK